MDTETLDNADVTTKPDAPRIPPPPDVGAPPTASGPPPPQEKPPKPKEVQIIFRINEEDRPKLDKGILLAHRLRLIEKPTLEGFMHYCMEKGFQWMWVEVDKRKRG